MFPQKGGRFQLFLSSINLKAVAPDSWLYPNDAGRQPFVKVCEDIIKLSSVTVLGPTDSYLLSAVCGSFLS